MAEVDVRPFGVLEGREIRATRLTTASGFSLEVLDYGATVRSLMVRAGEIQRDIVLGLDDLDAYLKNTVFLGGIVGRFANRVGLSSFELDGKTYKLFASDPPHHLHGGKKGWDKVIWSSEARATDTEASVVLRYRSPDQEEGYPGNVSAEVIYGLTEAGEFTVTMRATTDRRTYVSMAQHNYYNLKGPGGGSTRDHEVTLFADEYTPAGASGVPDGRTQSVEGGPLDFRERCVHGARWAELGAEKPGYDHNFVVRGTPGELRPVAEVREPYSGLTMVLEANQPGVQFYSGQFLDGSLRGKGAVLGPYAGLCLETQAFPNAVNVPAWAPQALLEPGQTYEHRMVHRFFVS